MTQLERATPEFFQTASSIISTEVEIAATPDEAWTVLNDHAGWVEWFPGAKSVVAQPPHWEAPGDTRQIRVSFLNVSEEAIIVEPGADFAFAILEWQIPIAKRAAERVQLVDTSRDGEDRVNLIYTGAFELTLSGRLAWSVMEVRFAGLWGAALENINDVVAKRRG